MTAPEELPAPPPPMTLREFLLSGLICLAFVGLYFRAPLTTTGIVQDASIHVEPGRGLEGAAEDVYLGHPPYYFAAQQLRRGRFPLWTPFACGGAPFFGNQNSGVFSPLHLLFYLIPISWIQYFWTVLYALCFFTAWSAVFVLARWYGIDFAGAVFAAAWYTFSPVLSGYKIEMPGQSGVFTPAFLLMAEQFLSGNRRRGLLFLPWMTALPLLSGHFQVSFYAFLFVGLYTLISLLRDKRLPSGGLWRGLWTYGAAAGAGVAIAAASLAAGLEYIAHSYTKVWRSLPEFSWTFYRVSKALSEEDAACLLLGWGAAGLAAFLLRRYLSRTRAGGSWLGPWLGAGTALTISLAALMSAGMVTPLAQLVRLTSSPFLGLFPGVFICLMGALALEDPRLPQRLRIVAGLVLAGVLIYLKTPGFIHLFYDVSIFKTLYLDNYNTFIDLGLGLLAGWGVSRAGRLLGQKLPERAGALLGAGRLALLALGAAVLAHPLQGPVTELLGTGINPRFVSDSENARVGGITDGGTKLVFGSRHTIRGWAADGQALKGVAVGFQQGNGAPTLAPAKLRFSGGRAYFSEELALPPGTSVPIAVLEEQRGGRRVWRGSDVNQRDAPSPASIAALGLFAVALGLLLVSPAPPKALAALVLVLLGIQVGVLGGEDSHPGTRDNLTRPWPGLQPLLADADPFRIYSFDTFFFPPGLPGIQGIADIRNGSDVLDVLPMIHFLNLTTALAGPGRERKADWTSRLLGIGNVKYVLARPNEQVPEKGLSPFYSGDDMRVYRNEGFQKRWRLYDRFKFIDGRGLDLWREGRQALAAIHSGILGGTIDPGADLLLHELPPLDYRQSAPAGKPGSVELIASDIDRAALKVDSPSPGFLFFSSNYYPGWRAYVDGRRQNLLRSWVTFCSVAVPAGSHRVDFIYFSSTLLAAFAATALAALGWLALWSLGLGPMETRAAAAEAAPKTAAKPPKGPKKQALPPLEPLPRRDGSVFVERWFAALIVPTLAYWALWCAGVYQGGLAPKIRALAQLSLTRKTAAELGYLGFPYAMGPFEGWPVNAAAALALAAAAALAARRLRRPDGNAP